MRIPRLFCARLRCPHVSEIRQVIPVPKGTLSYWLRDITLMPEQIEAIKQRTYGRKGIPRNTQRKRLAAIDQLEEAAAASALDLLNDAAWTTGVALYWGEGAKTNRTLALTNSDPALLRHFISWVRRYHDPSSEFVLALHLHQGNDDYQARLYWADPLELPDVDFHKTFIKPAGTGHRKNTLRHGICRVMVRRSTDAWLRTMVWIRVLGEQDHCYPRTGSLAQPG